MTDTSNNELPAIAQVALEAYQRMTETKNIYYGFLQSLDAKYEKGEQPSEEENQQLGVMLEAHSEKVAAFNEAMRAVVEPADRELLLDKMR